MEFADHIRELAASGPDGVCDLVDAFIGEGLRRQASDIHVEQGEGRVFVRFRLDGVLHPAVSVPTEFGSNIVARIKVLAELLTYQTDVPQEGRINKEKVGAPADLRVATFPTVHGEKAVIRLFDPRTAQLGLSDLGYPEEIRRQLERRLQMPKGVILLTGPAGSGKTTTIYATLQFILEHTGGAKNVVTVEDPVERVLEGVTQTQVRPAAGLDFARCLRSLMRQDPEVIVIGEIRDGETANIAIEAGLTGHLVITTIHSGTAPGTFTRLLDMGVEPYLTTSAVTFVLAQRLVRRLCESCKRRIEDESDLLGLPPELLGGACDAVGCPDCFGTGYAGRTVIVECLQVSEPVRRLVLERAEADALERAAVEAGMRPLSEAAHEIVRQGLTSPAEVRRVLGPD